MCAASPPRKISISSGNASTSRSGGPSWVEYPGRDRCSTWRFFPFARRHSREIIRAPEESRGSHEPCTVGSGDGHIRGPWSDWGPWLDAMKLGDLRPAGTLRFSHYDQVVQAAIGGSGVAIGRNPHNARHLREGLLVAPFGRKVTLSWGTYFVLIAPRSPNAQSSKSSSPGCGTRFAKTPQQRPSAKTLVSAGRSSSGHPTRADQSPMHPTPAPRPIE